MSILQRPLIISHRGNGNAYPENTIEACEEAIRAGAEALEIDIRYCGSGEMVVFHDAKLRRLLNIPKLIWTTSLQELKSYTFPGLSPGIRVPTLEEFLEHFRKRIPINLDLKAWWPLVGQFSRDVVRVIKRTGSLDDIWVSSFNPILLKTIKLNTERIKTGYLFKRWPLTHHALDRVWHSEAWHPHQFLINERFVERARRMNKEIYVWTVNLEADIRKIRGNNHVHGIISDNPALLSSLIK
jgi:glycerophosphoryl diester phosphodiesterase